MSLDAVLAKIDESLPAATDRLFELLRIPSISTDPAFAADCARAADWIAADLAGLGFDASARPTPGHPMVVGHAKGPGRHFLFYGHYDVQPVDPLNLWHRDPFDPAIEDTPAGKVIRARGASDDKGQLMTFIEACRAWKAEHGSLPGNLTIFLEGGGIRLAVPHPLHEGECRRTDRRYRADLRHLDGLARHPVDRLAASRYAEGRIHYPRAEDRPPFRPLRRPGP